MFEQTFKNIDDIFHKDAGCSSELDYTEQSSWMLFLKYLDDLEFTKSQEAELMAEDYQYIIDAEYRWSSWAAPKTANGEFDHDNALTGSDLMDFVDGCLINVGIIFSLKSPPKSIRTSMPFLFENH